VTGKIDILHHKDGDDVYVADYKTGKPFTDWVKGNLEHEKIKLHFYRYQLIFYKMLIQGSKRYKNLNVLGGVLEFVEGDTELCDLYLDIKDEDVRRLQKLIVAVYKRIMSHDFSVPESVLGLGELEGVEEFERVLLGE
jgi:DNA helicase-2/ATP-dependent DNA helicase PcrA